MRDRSTMDDHGTTSTTPAPITRPPLITIDDAAALLSLSPRTVRRMCREGKAFRAAKMGEGSGGVWRINTRDLSEKYGLGIVVAG